MFWLWLACRSDAVVEGTIPLEENSSQPSEYLPPENVSSQDQDWDLEGLSNAVTDALAGIRTHHATLILEGYSMVMSHADTYCPQAYTVNGNSFWYGVCTSAAGMSYDGYLFYNTYEEYDLFGDGSIWDAEVLSGVTQMVAPDGRLIHWGGSAQLGEGITRDGYPVFYSNITGSFLDDGSEVDWLAEGQSDTLMMYGMSFSSDSLVSTNALMVSGSMQWSGAATAIQFDSVITYSTAIGYPCWKEPHGTISVRDAYGRWVDVTFDVNMDWVLEGECDGCGRALFNGVDVGEICIDTAPMLDWRDSPWE